MDEARNEITQSQFDRLLTETLNATVKEGPYWQRAEVTLKETIEVPDEGRIENSSFYGYGGSYTRKETIEKKVEALILDVGALLDHEGFSRRIFSLELPSDFREHDILIQINAANCQEKLPPFSEEDKQALKESVVGKYKIKTDKFRAFVQTPGLFSLEELTELYKECRSILRGGALREYAEVIYTYNSAVDGARFQQERNEKKVQPKLDQFWVRKAPQPPRRPNDDEEDKNTRDPKVSRTEREGP